MGAVGFFYDGELPLRNSLLLTPFFFLIQFSITFSLIILKNVLPILLWYLQISLQQLPFALSLQYNFQCHYSNIMFTF